jgi:hypothetical protein
MAIPVTNSNISTSWCTSFFAVIFDTSEPCHTYYTLDGSDPTVISNPSRYLYTTPFIIETEGITTVKYYSISISTSQANAVQTESVKIDGIAPVSTIHVNIQPDGENGWYNSLPVITITANDAVSGIDKIYYSWDGTTFQEYTTALSIPNEGIHYIQVYAIDFASNKENVQTKVFKYDNVAPTTAITVPLEVVHNPVTINFTITDSASGQQATYYTTDGSTPTRNLKPATSFEIKTSGLYIIKFFSVDNAGNIEVIKDSIPFRVEIEPEVLQVIMTESFPINGENGWYRSSPQIGLLTTKPELVTKLQYKIAPNARPTTATYTSTFQITSLIDLSRGSFIALEIDKSGTPLVINIRGVDSTKTSMQDILDQINNTVGGDILVATQTGADGLAGTGYITVTSPTSGTGSPTSEIKFVSPGTYDATETVFGLSIDTYPHTFTETYLYHDYTSHFVLPGDGVWQVAATANTDTETATIQKIYKVDSTAPVTTLTVIPDHGSGYYTTTPNITFSALDNASGVSKIIYQFDEDPTLEYHSEDGPIQLPYTSKVIRLVYFSVDISGNVETPHERLFDYDFIKPATATDATAINAYNELNIILSWAHVIENDNFYPMLTDSLRQNLTTYTDWSSLMSYLTVMNVDPTIKTFTVNIVNDILTTSVPHNLTDGCVIQFHTTVQLPDPLLDNRYYYATRVSATQIKVANTYMDAYIHNNIDITNTGIGVQTLNRAKPEIIVSDPLRIFLKPVDDRQYTITDETILTKDHTKNELTTVHNFLFSVSHVRNVTTSTDLTVNYISNNKIYTIEVFTDTDNIQVSYVYSGISHVYYAINGEPTTLSPEGTIIDLLNNGVSSIKWFAVDAAGNTEDVKDLGATVAVLNRAPVVNVNIVKNTDHTSFSPNGTNSWYKLDQSTPTLRPSIKTQVSSPNVFVFNEHSTLISVSGSGPFTCIYQTLQINTSYETLTVATRVQNTTQSQTYAVISVSGNQITVSANAVPLISDNVEVDYTYCTLFNTTIGSGSKQIIIGDINDPDIEVDFSDKSSPFIYPDDILPPIPSYDIQGPKDITTIVIDKRGRQTTNTSISELSGHNTLQLDTHAPISTDDAASGWTTSDVTVAINSNDYTVPLPDPYHQSPSGVYEILYSTDGTDPSISSPGSAASVTLSNTGQYIVKYRGVDNAGNYEAIEESLPVQIDKTAPDTFPNVLPPDGSNGWYITAPNIVLTSNDPDSGVYRIYYKWDSDTFFSIYVTSLLMPSEGIHTLHFYSIDNVGNTESVKQQVFKLDITTPITTDSITTNWASNRIVQLTVNAISSGVYRTYYEFAVSPIVPPDPTTSSSYTTTQQIAFAASGIYNIKYFTVSNAGNVESVKTASNPLKLDLEKPVVTSIDPANLVFTIQTHLTVNFADVLSGMDVNSVKIVVDDIEYSTIKNAAFFSYTGIVPYNTLQVKVGPVASIPNFKDLDNVVIYANDNAGNALIPVVVGIFPTDTTAPYVRGFWPKHKTEDVSRDTNVMIFLDDDISGLDLRTVKVKIANTTYNVSTLDVMTVTYSGSLPDVFLDVLDNNLYVTVGGVVVATANLTNDEYSTVKKVSVFLDAIPGFSTVIVNSDYAQISSLEFINLYHVQVNPKFTMFVARFEDNKNIYYIPRGRGYLLAITPSETFEDGYTVNVSIDAKDFSGNVMVTDKYYFTCREIATPPREFRDRWYQYHIGIMNRILGNLESTYNKDSESTVFYGYFKSLALEIARSMQVSEDYSRDNYYDQTRPDLLYQNLGYLLKFEPRPDFSHDRYREVLITLMQMFFKGSTKQSLIDGLSVFLGVQSVSIREYLDNIAWQFMFSFDVDIGNTPIVNWSEFNDNITSVLKLVKPAHTYFLLRYVFSEIVRTKDIHDEVSKFDLHFYGDEDVRTDCANKYKKADVITENVTAQFNGSNNCCYAYYKPILNLAENKITTDPIDIQLVVTPAGPPISVISVNGFTGKICLSRNPLVTETVKIIYKFNKYVIYRELRLYTNTYTVTGGVFDLTKKALLNQVNVPSDAIISYNLPEGKHAHICETGVFFDVHVGPLNEKWKKPEEAMFFDANDFHSERVEFDIRENVNFGALITEQFELPDERLMMRFAIPYYERVTTVDNEYGFAHETNAHPFTTNDLDSITNESTDMLFFWIERFFGG